MLPRLFKECVESLNKSVVILSPQDTNKIFEDFEKELPILSWGRVDWDKINRKVVVESFDQVMHELEKLLGKPIDTSVYVLWNDGSVPVIKSDLKALMQHIDDVTCVAPDTWFWNRDTGYIIEAFHEDNGFFIGLT